MNKLPFELNKAHKRITKNSWKHKGMKFNEDFEYIYNKYITAINCELCNKEFKNTRDRQLDHCHKTGDIRNIVCRSCNQKKTDNKIRTDNISGYKHISKQKCSSCKQGFLWVFKLYYNGKRKPIKNSVDLDKLVAFRDKWIVANNYHT